MLETPRRVRQALEGLGLSGDQIDGYLARLAPRTALRNLISGPYELIGELLSAELVVVIDWAGALARQQPDASAIDGEIAWLHLWTGVCLAINEFRGWLLSHGWAETHVDELVAVAKRAAPTDTAGDSISEWTLHLLRGGMADILDVLSRTDGIDVDEFAKRLLREFDNAVDACSAGEWVRSLDASVPPTELPLVHHNQQRQQPNADDDPDDLPRRGSGRLRWRKVDSWIRWVEEKNQQEKSVEHRHLERMIEGHWDSLEKADVLIVPALLGCAYRTTPEESVPQRYYWTFVTGYAWTSAQPIFYQSLNPSQTAALCRFGFRSGREDEFSERAWQIPAALSHVLNLLLQDDEVALRRLRIHDFRKFGPSHALLWS